MTNLITAEEAQNLLAEATDKAYDLEVVKWEGGVRCVYLNDSRIAGEKPWGGGDTIRRFKVSVADVMGAFRGTVQNAAPDLARTVIAIHAELAQARDESDGAHMVLATEKAENAALRAELTQARADAKAAVAVVVSTAAAIVSAVEEELRERGDYSDQLNAYIDAANGARFAHTAIRAIAHEDAIAEVAKLRAERDALFRRATLAEEWRDHDKARVTELAAELAAANAREAGLRAALAFYAPSVSNGIQWAGGDDAGRRATEAILAHDAALAQPSTENRE